MNAQQLIDEAKIYFEAEEVMKRFYPVFWMQKQTDRNITKLCRRQNEMSCM